MTLPDVRPLGDSAVIVRVGAQRSAALLSRVHALAATLRSANIPYVEDIVPAYLSIAVFYDPLQTTCARLSEELLRVCSERESVPTDAVQHREHTIPVRYDGMDLEAVANATGLSSEEVISRHSGRRYTVDILGFVPGFAYLSELDQSLNLPRRAEPRPRVSAGSVAIAGTQTAVYPLDTPGGWHIIGKTDVVMFDPSRAEPALLRPGDHVRFERVR